MCRLWNIFIKNITKREVDFPMSFAFFPIISGPGVIQIG